MQNFGIIGTGNMGMAIIKGIKNSDLSKEFDLIAFDKFTTNNDELVNLGVEIADTASEVVQKCKYILFAVKPQNMNELLTEIKANVTKDKVLISICAGISEEFIKSRTIPEAKTVLVMPNTPMMLGLGASAIARDSLILDEEFSVAKSVIASCGIAVEIPIEKMKEVIAINGSSPAFIYLFAKGFIDYANEVGIAPESALELFAKSLEGSAKMLTNSGLTVDELIKQVSSPGGTTMAGLEALYEGDLVGVVREAASACTRRAYELQEG